MTTALVVGGASCIWNDVERARALFTPDVTIVINDIGTIWPEEINHWCSYHVDMLIDIWAPIRRNNGLPPADQIWSGAKSRWHRVYKQVTDAAILGGSSGMLGAYVGLQTAQKVVLAGIPMDPNMGHWNNRKSGAPWKDCLNYQKHWIENKGLLAERVRSVSGWTMELLGAPNEAWIEESNQ